MRGGGSQRGRGRGRGRGRRRGDDRNLSPPPSSNVIDHRQGSRYCQSRRSLSPPANRWAVPRSLSPLPGRPRQSPAERDYPLSRQRGPTSALDDDGIRFQHDYMIPDYPTDLNNVHALLKSSSPNTKEKDLVGGSTSSAIDSQGALVHKSLYMDDGSKCTFYSLPQDPARPFGSSALTGVGSGSSVNQRFRDSRDDKEGHEPYARDISYPGIPSNSHMRPFVGNSSSSFTKDTDGDRAGVGKLLDDSLGHNPYNKAQLSNHLRRAPVSLPAREEPLEYGYNEAGQRGRDGHGYLPSDGPCQYDKTVYGAQREHRDPTGTSFSNHAVGRVDKVDAYHKRFSEGSLWDQHPRCDSPMDFRNVEMIHKDYDGSYESGYVGCRSGASRDHVPSFEEESYRFGRGAALVTYRERLNSPLLDDHPLDAYRHAVRSPRRESKFYGDFDDVDPLPERRVRRDYVMTDELNGPNVHIRRRSPVHDNEMLSNEEYEYVEENRRLLHPKEPVIRRFRRSHYKLSSHKLPRNDIRVQPGNSSPYLGDSRGISFKKRLRPAPSDSYGKEIFRPHKDWRRGQENGNGSLNAPLEDVPFDDVTHMKKDPPEDSEEFKQQIHKAFLRFSKLLNESPHQQKRFRDDQEKSTKLLCCVCGRLSKEFVDLHSLLTHSYHSHKVGLRTDHLGLHKALCVLNGWNWLVVPDTSKSYKRRPPSELKVLKEDLILWPPIVIIHNSSIGNKSKSIGPRVVSMESMEEILKEMGFSAGKTKVSRGKPANQSVLLVKFMPTLSGLQEAERLHKYYADNKRGRQGFQQITSNNGINGEVQVEKDEELLYGYMAVAEDLDKLDPETKKRSLVKSKKEIEAIADAPLKVD